LELKNSEGKTMGGADGACWPCVSEAGRRDESGARKPGDREGNLVAA